MSTVAENETQAAQADLLEMVRAPGSENQRAVLTYALFLQQQEDEVRSIDADEAEWDKLFNDPEKMARLEAWAEQCAQQPAEPLDESRL